MSFFLWLVFDIWWFIFSQSSYLLDRRSKDRFGTIKSVFIYWLKSQINGFKPFLVWAIDEFILIEISSQANCEWWFMNNKSKHPITFDFRLKLRFALFFCRKCTWIYEVIKLVWRVVSHGKIWNGCQCRWDSKGIIKFVVTMNLCVRSRIGHFVYIENL